MRSRPGKPTVHGVLDAVREWEVFVGFGPVLKGYFFAADSEEEAKSLAASRFPQGQVEGAREVEPGKDVWGKPRG